MPAQGVPAVTGGTTPCEGAEIVARIGFDAILAREVSLGVPKISVQLPKLMEMNRGKAPPDVLESQLKAMIELKVREAMREQLKQRVEEKLLFVDAMRKAPSESLKHLVDSIGRTFEDNVVPDLMKKLGAGSRRELDDRVQEEWGITLEMHKRAFVEQSMGAVWLREQVKPDQEISLEEMRAYYADHIKDFETPGRARWEQLMIRKSTSDARDKIGWMGNQVLDGVAWAEVAKAHSEGSTASSGGARDWTTQGSLVSKVLDAAIFSPELPLRQLSKVLEDEQGFHIIRVLEREDTQRKRFEQSEVQADIKEKIRSQRKADAKATFMARLHKEIPVWTAIDLEEGSSGPLAGSERHFQ